MSQINFLSNFSFKINDDVCNSCMKSEFTRKPFPTSITKTSDCFDLIHCDIWGKYWTPSLTNANNFLTIVDDHSRVVWVYPLKHKFETSFCLMHFHEMVKTQFEKNIKRIRCDNGGEFISNKMMGFYAEHGIILETTCPHTPQQNRVVERKHRHLLETARALMFEANLPKRFWGECILTATYIINRLPSQVIGNKTPYELLHGEKPYYDHMRVLGSLAYYLSIETNGDKFEIRGRSGVFMGYPSRTKGYKILNPSSGKIITSRDVKFAEKVFPFATKIQEGQNVEDDVFTPFPDETNHFVVDEEIETRDLSQKNPIDVQIGPLHGGPSTSQTSCDPVGTESIQQNVNGSKMKIIIM